MDNVHNEYNVTSWLQTKSMKELLAKETEIQKDHLKV